MAGKMLSEVLNTFMLAERDRQMELGRYKEGAKSSGSKDSPEEDEQQTCSYCQKKGHIAKNCKLTARDSRSAVNAASGSPNCPICNIAHTHTR